MRGAIGWPPLSPSVAAPELRERSRVFVDHGDVIPASLGIATLAEGEGFEPSRGFITPYSLSRRAPSATRSALRHRSIRAPGHRAVDGYRRGVTPVEALERIAELLMRGRAPSYREQAFRRAAREIVARPRRRAAAARRRRPAHRHPRRRREDRGGDRRGARGRDARVPREAAGRDRPSPAPTRARRCARSSRATCTRTPTGPTAATRSRRWRARRATSATSTSRSPTTRRA